MSHLRDPAGEVSRFLGLGETPQVEIYNWPLYAAFYVAYMESCKPQSALEVASAIASFAKSLSDDPHLLNEALCIARQAIDADDTHQRFLKSRETYS